MTNKTKTAESGILNSLNKYRDIIFCLFFAGITFLVVFFFCTPRAFSDDDWGIANYFAGVMGAEYATPYNKFINFVWGWVMYIMYKLIPGPNWFVVIQEIIVVLSFVILQFVLIQKLRKAFPFYWCYLLSSVLILSFAPSFICRLQFTQTAALGSIAGGILLFYSHEVKSRTGYVAGLALIIISALHRFGSFEMCLPFICLIWLDHSMRARDAVSIKGMAESLWRNKQVWISLGCVFAVCFVLSRINTAIYNSAYYAEYNEFNSARSSVVDYENADYADIAEELRAIGVSKNDYDCMITWMFADPSFFTADLFRQVAALQPKANDTIDYGAEIKEYFLNIMNPEIMYNKLFYMALIILALCLIVDLKHMIWYVPLLLGAVIFIELYLTVVVRRYPSYCRTGLLFALIASALVLTDYSNMKAVPEKLCGAAAVASSIAVILVLAPMGDEYFLTTKGTFEYNMDGLAMYEYMNSRADDIFYIPTGTGASGGLSPLRDSYSIFEETKPGIMRHVVGLGGWSTNNPWVNATYSSWGIDYPMSQAADENVYLLSTPGKANSLQIYLLEHRNMQTTKSLCGIQYGTTIYKITDCDMDTVPKEIGIVSGASVGFDAEHKTYDIAFEFDSAVSGMYRLFAYLEDEAGNGGYYMVFDGDSAFLETGKQSFIVKIPEDELNPGRYEMNIMVQDAGGNYLNDAEDLEIIIPED